MRVFSVLRRALGVERALVEDVEFEGDSVVVHARLHKRQQLRCSRCGRRCGRHDVGRGRRRWRSLDLGTLKTYIEADAPRVRCRRCGVVVAAVTWARPGSGYTRAFEDQTAWLAARASQSVVSQLMRTSWRSVGRILRRVIDDRRQGVDLLDGVRRVGIDETSYRRGHRYLTVVVCHDTGRLVWAHPGNSRKTIEAFLAALGPERCRLLTHVTCDGAEWIHATIGKACPNAVICMDAFHVVKWATEAVDQIRRELWNDARRSGNRQAALDVKGARWALLKNPESLSERQAATLADLERDNGPLYRAYLLKEQLRLLLKQPPKQALALLDQWLAWADDSGLAPFRKIATTIRRIRPQIDAMIEHRLTNGRVESINAKIRLIQQRAFGFHDPWALISLAMLTLSGLCPPLPR